MLLTGDFRAHVCAAAESIWTFAGLILTRGYEKYDFEVPTESDGDVWARYLVRMREMKESHKIVTQALARLKPGPVKADAPKVVFRIAKR